MSEPLTREEIKKAALAVGWWWNEDGGFAHPEEYPSVRRFHPAAARDMDRLRGDALALLEALGQDYKIIRMHRGPYAGYGVWWVGDPGPIPTYPTLPAAAVRAVNQATEGGSGGQAG